MGRKRSKKTTVERPRRTHYQLSFFPPAIAPVGIESCGCPGLKPGLDASICTDCSVAWRHPWRQSVEPGKDHSAITREVLMLTPISTVPTPAKPVGAAPVKSAVKTAATAPSTDRKTNLKKSTKSTDERPPRRQKTTAKNNNKKRTSKPKNKSTNRLRFALTVTPEEMYALTEFDADLINKNWRSPLRVGERILIVGVADPKPISTHQPLNSTLMKTLGDLCQKQPVGTAAIATYQGVVESSESQWWGCCKFGLKVSDILSLPEPLDCEYRGGLWRIPDSILAILPEEKQRTANNNNHCTHQSRRDVCNDSTT